MAGKNMFSAMPSQHNAARMRSPLSSQSAADGIVDLSDAAPVWGGRRAVLLLDPITHALVYGQRIIQAAQPVAWRHLHIVSLPQ